MAEYRNQQTPGAGRGIVIHGAQWGDEGKGKIVDLLTETAKAVPFPRPPLWATIRSLATAWCPTGV